MRTVIIVNQMVDGKIEDVVLVSDIDEFLEINREAEEIVEIVEGMESGESYILNLGAGGVTEIIRLDIEAPVVTNPKRKRKRTR